MVHFPTNVFQEVMQITYALKRNALDQTEQTIDGALENAHFISFPSYQNQLSPIRESETN